MAADTPDTLLALFAMPLSDFVQASYSILLGRNPEPHEVAARMGVLRTGWGRVRLLENILSSGEYEAHERALLRDATPRAFLERCYMLYLKRMPDTEGLAHFSAMIEAGKPRSDVRADIASSDEAALKGSFWTELDRLVADERKNMQKFGRFFGRSRRAERRRNLDLEILLLQGEMRGLSRNGELDHMAPALRTPRGESTALQNLAAGSAHAGSATPLPAGARRQLKRLLHFQPGAWSLNARAPQGTL